MIRILDEEIDKFLSSIPHLQRKSLNQIKRK